MTGRTLTKTAVVISAWLLSASSADAQAPPREPVPPEGAPLWAAELTGYWESVISQNWRLRMVTPPRGDYVGIPINAEAQKVADAWNPERDAADGEQCRSYGAPIVMLNPGHLHLTWEDPKTLRMDIDNGTQSRVFHFDNETHEASASWQGTSSAKWMFRRSIEARFGKAATPDAESRYLRVSTQNLRPGYLRKNGVPYSADARLVEDFDLISGPDGHVWLVVTTTVSDPKFLDYPLTMTAQFRKQGDSSLWEPTPCSSTW